MRSSTISQSGLDKKSNTNLSVGQALYRKHESEEFFRYKYSSGKKDYVILKNEKTEKYSVEINSLLAKICRVVYNFFVTAYYHVVEADLLANDIEQYFKPQNQG